MSCIRRSCIRRLSVLVPVLASALLASVLVGCATPPRAQPHRLPVKHRKAPPIQVHVDVKPGLLDVDYRLPLAWLPSLPKTVDLRFFAQAVFSKAGQKRYVDFVRLLGPKGQELPFGGHFQLPGPYVRHGTLHIHYRVRLKHHEAGPIYGRDDAPHPTKKGWQLIGRAFLPQTILLDKNKRLGLRTQLSFSLPSGWHMTSTFDRDDTEFHGRTMAMVHAVYHVGRFARREVHQGKTVVEIVSGDFDARELAPVEKLVGAALDQGEALLGKLGKRRLLVVIDKNPEGFQGGVIGGTVTVTTAVAPLPNAMEATGVVLIHELMHLWNRADRFWLHEGMARYLELLVKLRVDHASPARAIDELLSIYRAYRQHAKAGRTIAKAQALAYDGGATALFCADAELRAQHQGTILDVHRATRAHATSSGGRLSTQGFLAEIARRSPAIAKRLVKRLASTQPIDIAPCLVAAGYAPTTLTYRGYTHKAILTDVLRVSCLTG
ncbi:MAG: hypothetical protein KAI47_24950, partial [Deltaproteobacteria bacterium]|nr:hypothetical protein [Deltaproteobacteria bacterium]